MKTIGIIIERNRTYGRRLCQGIAAYFREKEDWQLKLIEPAFLGHPKSLSCFDGFIARVNNDRLGELLAATRKPVVDVFYEKPRPGMSAADQNAQLIGQMAASHFIEHYFTSFAFCGLNGVAFSDQRRDAFINSLNTSHFNCSVYHTPAKAVRDYRMKSAEHDMIYTLSDRAQIGKWLDSLKKPIAIFCSNDARAYQVIEICREKGIPVPDKVAVLGVDDELVCDFIYPTLSSIDPNGFEIGRSSAILLEKMIYEPGVVPPPIFVGPRGLITRGSTRVYPLDPPWISTAMIFIKANLSKHLTASDVYQHLGKSHTQVDLAFRKILSTTVQKEIIRMRAEEAYRLVTTTDLPLSRIATMTGFASAQYFCSTFTKAYGKSPTKFRTSDGNHP